MFSLETALDLAIITDKLEEIPKMKVFSSGDHRAITAAVERLRPHERLLVVDSTDESATMYEVMRVPSGLIYVHWDETTSNSVFVPHAD